MGRWLRVALTVLASLAMLPSVASAQAFITGVVKDTSGGVLPGVTVEAASTALIEKTRSVVTDATGQYRIENLRPGTYTVTFTLTGFNTVKREGIELTGTFTASVNAELRVGALEETITVRGETPVVDVQSTTRQRVLDQEVLDIAPVNRSPVFMAALIPAVATVNQDVGGLRGLGAAGAGSGDVSVHGSSDTRMLTNGVSLHSANGGYQQGAPNLAAYQEVVVDTGGISAEQKEGGVRMNLIPRDGGNTPRGYFLGAFANNSMQGDNFTQDLKDRGLGTPDSVKKFWDVNPAFGGPIKKDKVWFHTTIRYTGALNYVPIFYNKNAGNPNAWTYEPDTSRPAASRDNIWRNGVARVTWQATQRHKLAIGVDQSASCECPRMLTAEIAPEASLSTHAFLNPKRLISGDWTAPATNRLLFEAAFVQHTERGRRQNVNIYFPQQPATKMVGVLEQSNNLSYRATRGGDQNSLNTTFFYRGAVSYITGAHAFKIGFNNYTGTQDQRVSEIDAPIGYRFNNGVPNQLTLQAWPTWSVTKMNADLGLFVQDRWTVKRVTLTVGLRYDYFHDSFPEVTIGPGLYVPTRNIVFRETDGVRWHDLQPRSGLAYDLVGDGKTALKISLNKYLASQAASGTFGQSLSPASRLVVSTNRSWRDANNNFVPDCDLLNPATNGECGPMSDPNFGGTRPGTTYDPELLKGWGRREYNWEFSAGVQRELVTRVSMDVSYFRRWFGNQLVTDDRAVSPSDYDTFNITAPADPRLPGGGGYVVSGLYDLKPSAFGRAADNFLTFADNYGKPIRHWNGVDVTINARPHAGVLLAGGTSTGRLSTDNCEIVAKIPESLFGAPALATGNNNVWLPASNCRQQEKFLTQMKFLGTYTLPRVDVQLTATIVSMPGPQILANYNATNAVVAPSLGRNLAGGANNVTVNLVEPGTMYGERRNQIDLRLGKIVKIGRARATASVDVYNALNTSAVLTQNNAFAAWQRPQQVLTARFAKVVMQLDF